MNAADDRSLDTRERDSARAWLIRFAIVAAVIATWTRSSVGYVIGGLILIAVGVAVVLVPRPTRASVLVLRNPRFARLADLGSAVMFGVIGVWLIVAGLL